jgi:hypothetical protein
VPGGRSLARFCATCGQVRTYVECDVKDSISAFLMTVFEATQRRMVCLDCGDDVAVDASPVPPAKRPPPSDVDKDTLLAALKKKMGL